MLVLISDLHLSDESTATNVNPDAFALLQGEIEHLAERRGAREIHLVLLGDIFDLVRTDYFHRQIKSEDRPWNGDLDPSTGMNRDLPGVQRQFEAVLNRILRPQNKAPHAFLALLRALTTNGVPAKVTYVVGNHDRVFNNFPTLQQALRDQLPGVDLAFSHVLMEPRYGVIARHGHEWDENNHAWTFHNKVLNRKNRLDQFDPDIYKVMSIGEVVTAELMSGLIYHVTRDGPQQDPAFDHLVRQLKDVNNLRPVLDVFQWLEWFGGQQVRGYHNILHGALQKALDGVLASALARKWDRLKTDFLVSGDLVDRLELVKNQILGKDFNSFRKHVQSARTVLDLVQPLAGGGDSFVEGAAKDVARQAAAIQYVVYGHTHQARYDYFSGDVDGRVTLYVNTGTYLPLIERTRDNRGFASAKQMTMTYFYDETEDTSDKRGGPSMDVWQGIRLKRYKEA